jgi:uncharacterized phage-associated protein
MLAFLVGESVMAFGHDPRDIAKYILWLGGKTALSPMQVLKLVYLCHGWMLGIHGRPLSAEPARAWAYGPVFLSVYHEYKKYRGNPIPDIPSEEPRGFDDEERDIMRQVWVEYGSYTGPELSTLTHQQGSPWQITRTSSRFPNSVISNDLIEDHYRRLADAK